MVGIRNVQFVYLGRPLDRVCFPYQLKDAGEGASELHGIWGDLPDRGLIHTWHPLVRLFQQFQDDMRPLVLLGNRHNPGHLEVFPK